VASLEPGTVRSFAPYIAICASFPGDALSGTRISHGIPALAAYAATAHPAFPEESSTISRIPISRALLRRTEAPRSL
jgi:hypothetical protein